MDKQTVLQSKLLYTMRPEIGECLVSSINFQISNSFTEFGIISEYAPSLPQEQINFQMERNTKSKRETHLFLVFSGSHSFTIDQKHMLTRIDLVYKILTKGYLFELIFLNQSDFTYYLIIFLHIRTSMFSLSSFSLKIS